MFVGLRQEKGGSKSHIRPKPLISNSTNLPPKILDTLEEAVNCHAAGSYKATALMVRRLLEELCEDKKAQGSTLKDRLSKLGSVAVIPTDLLDAADNLRLLGNDAAHVEAKAYDAIGVQEAALASRLPRNC